MFKAIDKWLMGYLRGQLGRPIRQLCSQAGRSRNVQKPCHLMFCVADHFEPFRGDVSKEAAEATVQRWLREYPDRFSSFRDADGKAPQHTFFYPQEEYDFECVENLAELCRSGFGEVEIHLHHRNDTADSLERKLTEFRDVLRNKHGLLGEERRAKSEEHRAESEEHRAESGEQRAESGEHRAESEEHRAESEEHRAETGDQRLETGDRRQGAGGRRQREENLQHSTFNIKSESIRYGFIHGNWALCNSRPDGDWCGVNEELSVLSKTGCYADFTFPSAPSATQPRMVNAIYRAWDRPGKPGGAEKGITLKVESEKLKAEIGKVKNRFQLSPSLMLITGPLALDWRRRKAGILPRLENGAMTNINPPTPRRVDAWVKRHIHVKGRPEWIFVKVYTHGCHEGCMGAVLGESMRQMHERLQSGYNDGSLWRLHYVTAREMYNIVRAAEDGCPGEPGQYRDYEVAPPPCCGQAEGEERNKPTNCTNLHE